MLPEDRELLSDDTLLCPYRGWYMWRGISGLVYARKLKYSPPVVFRAGGIDAEDKILDQIEDWIEAHTPGR